MEEIWKDIIGYEGIYQVSNMGRVKSLERKCKNRFGYYIKKEKLHQLNENNNNRISVCLRKNNTTKTTFVHFLVAQAFIPNPENKRCIYHIDKNKHNNKVENLIWLTNSEIKEMSDILNEKKSKIYKLLHETTEAYYWLGLLMADGHFDDRSITLFLKDINHVDSFKKYLDFKGELGKNQVKVGSIKYVPLINQKFNINKNKTINPCNIMNINNKKLLLSLIIGFIDGDGSIRKQYKRKGPILTIKCHSNWFKNLDFMLSTIYEYFNFEKNIVTRINSNGYATFNITDSVLLKKLKIEMLNLNIPYLKRKWNNIDLNFIGKYEQSKINCEKIKNLLKKNKSCKEISNLLDIKLCTVYNIIRNNNLKEVKNV